MGPTPEDVRKAVEMFQTELDATAPAIGEALDAVEADALLPCGCPSAIVADEGHQEGCEVRS